MDQRAPRDARAIEGVGEHARRPPRPACAPVARRADAQRSLLDAFGGFTTLTRGTARAGAHGRPRSSSATRAAAAQEPGCRARALRPPARTVTLAVTADEWASLAQAQSRLAHAAALLAAAASGEEELTEADSALTRRLASLIARLDAGAVHDPALNEVVALLEPARIQWSKPHASFARTPEARSRSRRAYPHRRAAGGDPRRGAKIPDPSRSVARAARADGGTTLGPRRRIRAARLAKRAAETEAAIARSPPSSTKRDSRRTSSRAASRTRCSSWR